MQNSTNNEIINLCNNIKRLGNVSDSSEEAGITFLTTMLNCCSNINNEMSKELLGVANQLRRKAQSPSTDNDRRIRFSAADSIGIMIKYSSHPAKKHIIRDIAQDMIPKLEDELRFNILERIKGKLNESGYSAVIDDAPGVFFKNLQSARAISIAEEIKEEFTN